MAASSLIIRNVERAEMHILREWAARLGWNPGKHDYEAYYHADPHGYFFGVLNGEIIASVSAVRYGSDYGYIGFYIVKEEYRAQGYGLQLFKHAMEYLKGRNIGLDGGVDQMHNFAKFGFVLCNKNIRHVGYGAEGQPVSPSVSAIDSVPFRELVTFDGLHFGTERDAFLKSWLWAPETYSVCVYENESIRGYGCIRPSEEGFRVGPLFAVDREAATILLAALRTKVPTSVKVLMDVPDANSSAATMVAEQGFVPVFPICRMRTGAIRVPLGNVYCSTTAALG